LPPRLLRGVAASSTKLERHMNFSLWLGRCALVLVFLGMAVDAEATTGVVDGSFGNSGLVRLSGLEAYGPSHMFTLPNGHIAYTAARPGFKDAVVGMLNPDGSYDTNFASGGLVSVISGGANGSISAPHLDFDPVSGRLVFAATDYQGGKYRIRLCRFLADGSKDPSFTLINYPGQSGCLSATPPAYPTLGFLVAGMHTSPSGVIQIAGTALDVSSSNFFKPFLASMQSGTVDVGATVTSISGNNVNINAMATDEVGSYTYMTGNIQLSDSNTAIVVVRAHSVLSWTWNILDVNLVSNGYDEGDAIAVRPDGNIVVAGTVDDFSPVFTDCAIFLLNSGLGQVAGFGPSNNRIVTNFTNGLDDSGRCTAVATDGQNRIYIGGVQGRISNSDYDMIVGRLTPGGQLDASFHGNVSDGITAIDPADSFSTTRDERTMAITLQNGRIVVGGTSAPMTGATVANTDMTMLRVQDDDFIHAGSFE
jgi:uncharacterized delta-60 repeat protein